VVAKTILYGSVRNPRCATTAKQPTTRWLNVLILRLAILVARLITEYEIVPVGPTDLVRDTRPLPGGTSNCLHTGIQYGPKKVQLPVSRFPVGTRPPATFISFGKTSNISEKGTCEYSCDTGRGFYIPSPPNPSHLSHRSLFPSFCFSLAGLYLPSPLPLPFLSSSSDSCSILSLSLCLSLSLSLSLSLCVSECLCVCVRSVTHTPDPKSNHTPNVGEPRTCKQMKVKPTSNRITKG